MAAKQCGMIDQDCSVCRTDPTIKDMWGCNSPSPVAVWVDEEGNDYHSCPLSFIGPEVYEFLAERKYNLDYGTAPKYKGQSNRYIEADIEYQAKLQYWQQEADALKKKRTK